MADGRVALLFAEYALDDDEGERLTADLVVELGEHVGCVSFALSEQRLGYHFGSSYKGANKTIGMTFLLLSTK